MKKAAQFAFSLIEILVVITIIAILAGLAFGLMSLSQTTAAKKRTEAEISALSSALQNYYAETGAYPEGTNGNPLSPAAPANGNAFFFARLQGSGGKVYDEFPASMVRNSNAVDPFGEEYGYRFPGTMNGSNFFDLWSRAGTTNSNSWIKNW